MSTTYFAVAVAVLLTLASPAHACISEGIRKEKMVDYKKRAQNLGIPDKAIKCLLKQGDDYEPKVHVIHGQTFKCYDDEDYTRHMVSAMSECLDLKPINVSRFVEGETIFEEEKQLTQRVLRRPVDPSSPMRKVAHWLGLKETVRDSCTCLSGCHYCCVNAGLSGDDQCFKLYCRSQGYCS